VVKQNNVHLAILSLNIEIINFQVIGISDGVVALRSISCGENILYF